MCAKKDNYMLKNNEAYVKKTKHIFKRKIK